MYDVAIIGGGPAGATLARLIGEDKKVLLIERRTFEPLYGLKQKCCGGLLAPDAQKMLALFRLGLPKAVILSPQMFAVRTFDIDNNFERYYQRHYINVDREEFDKWLLSLVPNKVDVLKGCIYKSHDTMKDYVRINYVQNASVHQANARLIVGADGAFSKVRRDSFPNAFQSNKYIAIQEWFENRQNINYYGSIFDSEISDFYSWIIPKEDSIIIGSALHLDKQINAKFDLLKERLIQKGLDLNKSIRKNGTYLLRPKKVKQIITGNDRVCLIGEAAGFISPSSAEGFSYAFRSAVALAFAIVEQQEESQKLYKDKVKKLKANIMLKNMKSPFMYNKTLRRIIMKSGILSVDVQ